MNKLFLFSFTIFFLLNRSPFALARIEIATSTTDLSALVKKVGQDKVDVFAIAKGTQDPHLIEAKPSYMVKLRTANLIISHGLDLESAWIPLLIQGSRNSQLNTKSGHYEIASDLDPLEIPKGAISRADGDVHPGGNPHFQLDPLRLGQAAIFIAKRLGDLDPSQKDFFLKNATDFQKEMNEKTKLWQVRIKKTGIKEIITYHKTFSYFCHRFEIQCNLQLEPKPGIPPTASHLLSIIDQMKKRQLNLVFIENLYEDTVRQKIKNDIPNVIVQRLPVSVEGESGIDNNAALIERLVSAIEKGHP